MKSANWERLRILRAVLEAGSLSGAARRLEISQPTVSRQVRMLEEELGLPLVEATPDGVLATDNALALLPMLEDMQRLAQEIGSSDGMSTEIPSVRIACGPWIARFLSLNTRFLVGDPVKRHIEIASSVLFTDIPRREADIAIRNHQPDRGRMRVKGLPHYSYAVYGAKSLVAGRDEAFDDRRFKVFEWAMLAPELDHFASSRWLLDHGVGAPVLRCSASVNLLDAVMGGGVLAVLPCFAGDREASLKRISEPFVPESGRIWMVLPEDVGRRPHVRDAADRLVELFESNLA